MESYNIEGEILDFRVLQLEKELETIQGEINVEKRKLKGFVGNVGLRAAISVFAESEGQVEIVLIYGERLLSFETRIHS
jgi:hypothetical protein